MITEYPEKSLRKMAQEVGTSHFTVRIILKKDLELFPYKMRVHNKLSEQNRRQRVDLSEWLKKKTAANPDFLEGIWFSDEAHFHLTGQVNSQNCRIWVSELHGN